MTAKGNPVQLKPTHSIGLSSSHAILATMHRKEQAIAPVFANELGITVTPIHDFDTDRYGTFTRDVKRLGTQTEAARLKARAALERTDGTIAIASEGAFFPHPDAPFVPCNREIVLLLDIDHDIEIIGQVISPKTNYRQTSVQSVDEALKFSYDAGFPSHGMVVMPVSSESDNHAILKGICTESALVDAIEATLNRSLSHTAHLETDMRAMHNPTRMEVIAEAAQDLIARIKQICPQCGCPGFDRVEQRSGLRCSLCGLPTTLTRSVLYRCQRCHAEEEKMYPDGVMSADPAQCWNCNP